MQALANLLEPTPFAPQGKCGVSPALTDFEWTAGIPAVKEGGTANDTLVPLYGTKVFFLQIYHLTRYPIVDQIFKE